MLITKGDHSIIVNQNKSNIGLCAHINKVVKIAKGNIIVVAAGDDISLPKRCDRIAEEFLSAPKQGRTFQCQFRPLEGGREWCGSTVMGVFSAMIRIDKEGNMIGETQLPSFTQMPLSATKIIRTMYGGFGATYAWNKEVFNYFGDIPNLIAEDVIIPFRCALLGEIRYVNEPLVKYRRHDVNTWKNKDDLTCREIYFAWDQKLTHHRHELLKACKKDLCKAFNILDPDEYKSLNHLIDQELLKYKFEAILVGGSKKKGGKSFTVRVYSKALAECLYCKENNKSFFSIIVL